MCWQHAAHHCALTGPGSLERDSSSREMRRGLPPGSTAMDALHSSRRTQTTEECTGCHARAGKETCAEGYVTNRYMCCAVAGMTAMDALQGAGTPVNEASSTLCCTCCKEYTA